MSKNYVFLIGSGLSCAEGFPSIEEITDEIYSLEDTYKSSNSHFYRGEKRPEEELFPEYYEYNTIIKKIIDEIKKEIEQYYRKEYQINYEEIYYMIKQIEDKYENENPAILAFIEKLKQEINPLLNININFDESVLNAVKYIENIVWNVLAKKVENSTILNFLLKELPRIEINIFSLNHDYLIEQILQENKINYINGFKPLTNEIKAWDHNLFDKKSRIKLYKLHGSISWVRYSVDDFRGYFYADIGINDIYHLKDIDGKFLWPVDDPRFLIGTVNKVIEYTREIFSELFYQFHKILKKTNLLIIIGYGFKDKGINSKIIEYMFYSLNKKIIIIDLKNKEELMEGARFAISNNVPRWEKEKRVKFVSKNIKDLTFEDLQFS